MKEWKKKVRRLLMPGLMAVLTGNIMGFPALAADDVTLTASGRSVIFTEEECSGGCQGHIITQNIQGGVVQAAEILVKSGVHNITFSGLKLTSANVGILPGGTMNLTINGTNTISAGGNLAGIYVPEEAKLTITASSSGSLTVSGKNSAGIGGAAFSADLDDKKLQNGNCGTIEINGGTITANGGDCSAGIGGAAVEDDKLGSGGTVTINGGIVTATGGGGAPGIGGAAIPNGKRGADGSLTLASAGVLNSSTVLGPKGTYYISGVPTADMISVPAGMHYTSADMAAEIASKVSLSGGETVICGKTFQINTEGWHLKVTKKSGLEYTASYTHADKGTISKPVIILPCNHNDGAALTHHEKVEADCLHTGILEYWSCSVCEKKFSDQDGQTEMTDTEIPRAAHQLTYHAALEANCTQPGNTEYWDCSVCGKAFSDQDGQTEISDTGIPMKPHTLTRHAKVEAGCLTEGNIEYWSCNVCNKLFTDGGGTEEVTDIKISATGHTYGEWESNKDGTHTRECTASGCNASETGDCSGGSASYTESAKCTVCGGAYGEILKDASVPTGEISIGTNKWRNFLHKVTFALFFKKTEQVTITAEDQESGVASVSYYISDSGLTEEEVKKLDNWTAGNTSTTTFSISRDESCVVYARITDNQGNVAYLSSDGLIFDGTPPCITGVADGKTYCEPQTVTVTDANLEFVKVNGKAVILSDNAFPLGAASGTQTIEAADKAGNITTRTVTVNAGHNYGTDWKSDESSHWHECACTEKSDVASHTEDGGKVTKPATETETGIRIYKCSACGREMRVETIEKLPQPEQNPDANRKPEQDKIDGEKNELDLNARLKASQTGKKINIAWGKVSGADGYDVYVQYIGRKFNAKSLIQVKDGEKTKLIVKKVNGKNLDTKKNLSVYVSAYKIINGKKYTLAKSITAYIAGKDSKKYTNTKAVKVRKSSYKLKKGKAAKIQAKTLPADKKKKLLPYAKQFRYASTDKKVAAVSGKGKIRAVGKGKCVIYIYAGNGYAKKIKIAVE